MSRGYFTFLSSLALESPAQKCEPDDFKHRTRLMKKPRVYGTALLLSMPILLAACATVTPHASNVTCGTGEEQLLTRRVPKGVFMLEDAVVCYVDFQWADVTQRGGRHEVEWQWFKDGSLVSQGEKRYRTFKTSPWTSWSRRAAGSLGAGHFAVKVLLDGSIASSGEFEIR
jgi:hypothetical protein